MGNSEGMGPAILTWTERLTRLRARTDELLGTGAAPALRALEDATRDFGRFRHALRPLLDAIGAAYAELCPNGYPRIEDNEIPGPGGSVGMRFSAWHAFYVAFENAKKPKSADPKPTGLAGALDI